jgi:phage minor structural protein
MLWVFDYKTDKMLAVLSNDSNDMMPYWNAEVKEQLNKDYTFEFITAADHEDSPHIAEGNLVAFKDMDGKYQLFQIWKIEEYRTETQADIQKKVYCEHNYYELLDDVVEDLRVTDGTINDAMTKALSKSRWQVGSVAPFGIGSVSFYYSNAMQNLRDIQDIWGGELGFRVEFNDAGITGRYVDFLARRGADTGRRFEYTKDLTDIQRTVDATGVKTALYGRGAGEQLESGGYTRKTTIADVVWTTPTNPVDKPAGQQWIGDPTSLAIFGKENGTRHRVGVVDFDTTDPNELIALTWAALQEVNKPKITYELKVMDLEQLSGYDHMKVRLGDTVYIIDKGFNPIVQVEARVIEINRSLDEPEKAEIVIGNFIPLITEIGDQLAKIQAKITEKEAIWDNGGNAGGGGSNTDVIVDDGNFPNTTPPVPANFTANGLFENIALKWDYDPRLYVAYYEVYASQIQGFTPDNTNLVFKAKAGGYLHTAQPNQTWYFRVQAVNTHGVKSGLSAEISGATIAIHGDYIEALSIGDAQIGDVSADKMKTGTLDANQVDVVNVNADNINTGKLKGEFIEAEGITAEHLNVTAKYLINNPTRSLNLDGWEIVGEPSWLGDTAIKGNTKAMLVSSGNTLEATLAYSNIFEIDPSKNYQFNVSLFKSGLFGKIHFGVSLYDKDMIELTPKLYELETKTFRDGEASWDSYFWYQTVGAEINNGAGGYLELQGHLVSSDQLEIPTGKNVQRAVVMPHNAVYAKMRIFNTNGTVGSPSTLYAWSPTVTEVGSGIISWDMAKGGTLTLGGMNNEHGVLRIQDGEGKEVATLSGDAGGFSELKIDKLENTQNVVFKTSQAHPNYDAGQEEIQFFVDGMHGSDNATGTKNDPLQSIQEALDRSPKYLDLNVGIYITPTTYVENIRIEGFKGHGRLLLRSYIRDVRYIRAWQNGSSANTINHIVEFQAFDLDSYDREIPSANKYIASSYPATVTGSTQQPWQVVTDGVTASNPYVSFGTGSQWLLVDLGAVQEISGVKLWRYWSDGRKYKNTKIEVSSDNVEWRTLQDSAIHGEYAETKNGYDASRFRVTGSISVYNCDNVEIWGAWVQLSYKSTATPVYAKNAFLYMADCIVFGNAYSNYAIYAAYNSWLRLQKCEVNGAKNSNIIAAYHSRADVISTVGGDSPYGLNAYAGSVIIGSGSAPVGNTANTYKVFDGQIWTTFTHLVGDYTSIPPIVEKTVAKTWTSTKQNAWRDNYGGQWINEGVAAQGKWDGTWGLYRGFYFFGDVFGELRAADVKSIDKIRVYVTRASSSGNSGTVPVVIRTHGYTSQPTSGVPSLHTADQAIINLAYGQSGWVTLPSSMLEKFKNGTAKGIAIYTTATTNGYYTKMSGTCKLEATYTVLD